MSIHIGLHWNTMLGYVKKPSKESKWINFAAKILCIGISVYGIYAFITRQISNYMLLKTQFVFFDFNESIMRFLMDYVAMIVLFATLGHYLSKLFTRIKTN